MKLLGAALLLVACSEPPPTVVVMTTSDAPPAYGDTPFPTDAVRDGGGLGVIAGLDRIVGRNAELVAAHLSALDGFGVRPLVELFVDGDLDPDTIAARTTGIDEPAALVDVDPASPERGRVIPMDWRYDATRRVIAGSPITGEVLRERTRYAAFVTDTILDAYGHPVRASDDLARLAGDRWASTIEARDDLASAVSGKIVGLAVFTTESATAPMIAARTQLALAPPPVLRFDRPAVIFAGAAALDRVLGRATRATTGARAGLERWGNDNPTGIAHDHVGVVATGTMTVARFRGNDTGTDGPDDEAFAIDPLTGAPQLVTIDDIPITFILPAAAPPSTGYPVVIYGHGLGAGRDQLLSFAEPLTAQGYALVGIDMFGHGSRFDPVDTVANMSNQLVAFSGESAIPDGFGDRTGMASQLDFFEGFRNVTAVRDSIRQSALDLGRVVQLLRTPSLDLSPLGATAKLDTRRIAYLGESFGTVVGTLFAATEPAVDLYVLDVPGGGILDLLLPNSAEIGVLALPFVETVYDPIAPLDRWNPLIGMMQAILDGADPLTYAPHVLRDRFTIDGAQLGSRSVIAIEVIGDQVLANVGTDALARGLGLQVLAPHLAIPEGLTPIASPAAGNREGQTAVLVQYAPATHGANWSAEKGRLNYLPDFPAMGEIRFPLLPASVTIDQPIYETHEQVAEILQTYFAGEPPRVRSTKPPIADFDGDGRSDDIDAAPFDPAH